MSKWIDTVSRFDRDSSDTLVWVLEDDPVSSQALTTMLVEEAHYRCDSPATVAVALQRLTQDLPDAVILGGRGQRSNLVALPQFLDFDSELAVIVVTDERDGDATTAAVAQVGSLGVVHRPVRLTDLLPRLHARLERRYLAQEVRRARGELVNRERALRASKRQVETKALELESTYSDLHTATERLVEAEQFAVVGRVVGGIAHELERQLALVGYAQAIKARVQDDAELVELADIIVHAQLRLAGMVDEIRDFVSRDHPSAGPLSREPADVAAIVDEALSVLQYDRDARQRRYVRDYRVRPLAQLHRSKFAQVIINLVSNAVLATEPQGEIAVTLDVEQDGACVLQVTDKGVGMTQEVLGRLGEPFFTTRGDHGSGLGVGICIRIIEEHGGTLTFTSQPGGGTTARISLPILAVESTQ